MDIYDKEAKSINIGERLKKLREDRNLSIRALARLSDLSANAISVIERGKSSPSVSTLYKIANALEIPVTAFFKESPPKGKVVFQKGSNRIRIPFHRGLWEELGGENYTGQAEPFMLTLESGGDSGRFPMSHGGDEFVLCLRGQLTYQVGEQTYVLESGDSLLFDASLDHQWRNSGDTVANAVFVITGHSISESPSGVHFASATAGNTEEEDD